MEKNLTFHQFFVAGNNLTSSNHLYISFKGIIWRTTSLKLQALLAESVHSKLIVLTNNSLSHIKSRSTCSHHSVATRVTIVCECMKRFHPEAVIHKVIHTEMHTSSTALLV